MLAALGDARTVLNVGAGTGSYEPTDRWVLAVEPSETMRSQRSPSAAPALACRAESLPFDDGTFDAAMACATIHHWDPPEQGLAEMRRAARGPVVVFTFDAAVLPAWQRHYLAECVDVDQPRFPSVGVVAAALEAAPESNTYRPPLTASTDSSRHRVSDTAPTACPPNWRF